MEDLAASSHVARSGSCRLRCGWPSTLRALRHGRHACTNQAHSKETRSNGLRVPRCAWPGRIMGMGCIGGRIIGPIIPMGPIGPMPVMPGILRSEAEVSSSQNNPCSSTSRGQAAVPSFPSRRP